MHMSLAHNVSAADLVHIVEEVLQERAHRLVTHKSLGVFCTVKGFVNKCGDNTSCLCR